MRLALLAAGMPGLGAAESLKIERPTALGAVRLSLSASSKEAVILESSPDLAQWTELLRGHGEVQEAADLRVPAPERAFYRALVRPLTTADDSKHLLHYEDEPFRSDEPPPWRPDARWVKFALLQSAPHRAVFQDSSRYPFHYDFAVKRLEEFRGFTRAQFDAVTLRTNGQRAVLGAVLFPPSPVWREVGVQLVGADPYPREQVAQALHVVRASLGLPADVRFLYLPTFEQAAVAREHSAWFAGQGITVASPARWTVQDQCYAAGWTLGRLVYVPAAEIGAAYREGRLRPADLLLTDVVPAEVPPLAGILTLTPGTPNSHVALLAQSLGIPFVYFVAEEVQAELQGWVGREVLLRALALFDGCELSVAPLTEPLSETLRTEILKLKEPPPLQLPTKEHAGRTVLPVEGLHPSDRRIVGGKAANFGLVRAVLPANSPTPAVAIPFDLWDAYLDQPVASRGGARLRAEIARELGGFAWPPDMAALEPALERVRDLIRNATDFSAEQRAALLAALQNAGFATDRNIRFRSSTNVEDGEAFNGAGLYDSYSGCLADDLDDDVAGPSRCDATEAQERGVFRALRRVFASFYNDNAFLERLRHRVDESAVGMAVLVHPSTPDLEEWANGVATFEINRYGVAGEERGLSARLVTQEGAVSVTNPDNAARPEVVRANLFGGGAPYLEVESRSSLVPLGGTVLAWETEYQSLFRLLDKVAVAYEAALPKPRNLVLDFEYKKVAPGVLRVKQVREVPPSVVDQTYTPWLLSTTNHLVAFQGEHGDLLSMHRLKSSWSLAHRSLRVRPETVTNSVFREVSGEWREGTNRVVLHGPPAGLPEYQFARTTLPLVSFDRWSSGSGAAGRRMELRVDYTTLTDARMGPLTVLGDHSLMLTVTYPAPQPALGFEPRFTNTLSESVRLVAMPAVSAASKLQERVFRKGAVELHTKFYWPPDPKGVVAGYTAPLQAWVETTIRGLTTAPIVLRGDWSQTYHPGHHNFFEEFAFEPQLEESLAPTTRAELEQANLRVLIVTGGREEPPAEWLVLGLDGRFRPL